MDNPNNPLNDSDEPLEVEGFNNAWNKFFNWYSQNKEGFMITYKRTKDEIYFYFQNRWRF